jgi:hypothetical protein
MRSTGQITTSALEFAEASTRACIQRSEEDQASNASTQRQKNIAALHLLLCPIMLEAIQSLRTKLLAAQPPCRRKALPPHS